MRLVPPKPLLECITSGVIRGAVAMVGCNNPKVRPDTAHIELMKKLIANDIVIIASGCSAQAAAKCRTDGQGCKGSLRRRSEESLRAGRYPAGTAYGILRRYQPYADPCC